MSFVLVRLAGSVALIAAVLGVAAPAYAVAGLNQAVYHTLPAGLSYTPSDTTLNQVEAYFATATPSYTFVNTNVGLNYSNGGTTAQFFGSDAAGAALSDTASPNNSGFVASGSVVIAQAGSYTFSLGGAFNQTDDAARLYIDNVLVAEAAYMGDNSLAKSASFTGTLSQGAHSLKYVWYQLGGGLRTTYSVSGPAAVSYSTNVAAVPEPASWAMMVIGFGALGAMARRRRPVHFA